MHTLEGKKLRWRHNEESGLFTLETAFVILVKSKDAKMFFDFANNYVCYVELKDVKQAWVCYKKARKQRLDNTLNAFFNYLDGKRIVKRGKGVFQWV